MLNFKVRLNLFYGLKYYFKGIGNAYVIRIGMKLIETWVKAPFLSGASILLTGECVQSIYPDVYKAFAHGRTVLTSCPEAEDAGRVMGKLASILTCSSPRELTVLTVDGSPHCFTLHASVNEAIFTAKSKTLARHFVIVDGKALEVGSESVMVGRYLHLVQRCIERNPEIIEDLAKYSLEYRWFKKLGEGSLKPF